MMLGNREVLQTLKEQDFGVLEMAVYKLESLLG